MFCVFPAIPLPRAFWDLGRNALVDFLAVRGLKTSGGKAELVPRAFLAVELKLPITESSEK